MKLSELKTGESAIIVKVNGHGGFRKRIVEMGFIKGNTVEVLLNAPLLDPVKYKILGYEISLRREEAALVEVASLKDIGDSMPPKPDVNLTTCGNDHLRRIATQRSKQIKIVLVGNPNCGKTTLFNHLCGTHERVGNYSGVTVDAKEGKIVYNGYTFDVIDLPGTYSFTTYSPEELFVRKYIIEQTPDIIVNVVDGTNLERNLYLTTQLIDLDVPFVIALNMYDELVSSGNKLDIDLLGQLLGTKIIPTIAKNGHGKDDLLNLIIDVYEEHESAYRHIHVNHGKFLEDSIEKIEAKIRKNPEPHYNYSGRFLAIKLLENDNQVTEVASRFGNFHEIIATKELCQQEISNELNEDSESAITDAKYGYVQGALKECFQEKRIVDRKITKYIDSFVTNKFLGFPIFMLLLYFMFYCTFAIGQIPMNWIEYAINQFGNLFTCFIPEGALRDLIVDGIIGGVGGVIIFLPQILILYAFISWMEDSGYMARAAFIMDKIMHKMGLHGKSFIPMIMGFGCNIPAILATRTIEDKKSRLITMLIVPLMSCSARLPIYIIIIGAFFPHNSVLMLFTIYLFGILMSVVVAKLLNRFIIKGESSPFVMELPPYRLPSLSSVFRHTWDKGKEYLQKMGSTILLASICVWALCYYPHHQGVSNEEQLESSYIGKIGKTIEPLIKPCGFEWREGVSIIAGVGAKEIVASTMAVLFSQTEYESDNTVGNMEINGSAKLSRQIASSGITPLAAFCFVIFVLLYMPCIPSCIAIKNESGAWRWAVFAAVYTTVLAWVCAFLIFQIGSFFNIGV